MLSASAGAAIPAHKATADTIWRMRIAFSPLRKSPHQPWRKSAARERPDGERNEHKCSDATITAAIAAGRSRWGLVPLIQVNSDARAPRYASYQSGRAVAPPSFARQAFFAN